MGKHRQRFTAEFKARVVLESISGGKSGAEICREYGIRSQLLSKWRAYFLGRAASVFEEGQGSAAVEKARLAQLEQSVERQALEIEVPKKGLHDVGLPTQRKRALAMNLAGRYPVRTICSALDLPRSSYYYPMRQRPEAQVQAGLLQEAEAWPT